MEGVERKSHGRPSVAGMEGVGPRRGWFKSVEVEGGGSIETNG